MATSKQKSYIERLPDDLIMSILRRLDSSDLARTRRVCKTLYYLIYRLYAANARYLFTPKLLKRKQTSAGPSHTHVVLLDRLPHDVIVRNILGRLDSSDLARIGTVCKTLHSLSSQVTSISFCCSANRYRNSRPGTITPFKTVVKTLISNLPDLESISIHVAKDVKSKYICVDDDDTKDDLHLTDVSFVREWLPRYCDRLRVLKISDFFVQSHSKRSHVLGLISSNCNRLVELELRNAWLSAEGLKQLPTLTSLTFKFIRLDDEVLNKITTCFPRLKVLNLHRVMGLTHPKIHLLHLTSCQWTRPNWRLPAPLATPPFSLTIVAPSLISLTLNCENPRFLILETPSLSDLSISVARATRIQFEHNVRSRSLQLSSSNNPSDVMMAFTSGPIQKLSFNLQFDPSKTFSYTNISLESLFKTYPNLSSLTMGPGAGLRLHDWFFTEGWQSKPEMDKLREITLCVWGLDGFVDETGLIIASILERCTNLSDVTILLNERVDLSTSTSLMLRITTAFPGVNWNWGLWRMILLRGCSFPMGWDVLWQRPWKESLERIRGKITSVNGFLT